MADKRWEYLVEWLGEKSGQSWTAELNRLGLEGWELVTVIGSYENKGVFKREVPPDYSFLQAKIETDSEAT
jgi:hypothetical protein